MQRSGWDGIARGAAVGLIATLAVACQETTATAVDGRAPLCDGVWTDVETGSTWTIGGEAVDGPLQGERLDTRADVYTLFWFAWRHFQPTGATFRVE